MLSLRLPDSLHRMVRETVAKDSISINQFIATAVAEKVSALLTEDYLEQRARRADAAAFDRILSRVPDAPPAPGDERERPKPGGRRKKARPVAARRARRNRG
jgi:hypothetical protein